MWQRSDGGSVALAGWRKPVEFNYWCFRTSVRTTPLRPVAVAPLLVQGGEPCRLEACTTGLAVVVTSACGAGVSPAPRVQKLLMLNTESGEGIS